MDPEPRLKNYFLISAATILCYDFVCTFPQEVSYVWSRPWSLGTFFYTLNRYLPFVDISLSIRLMRTTLTPAECSRQFQIIAWLISIGMAISQVILLIRTYAVWHPRRSITIFLCLLGVITIVPALVAAHKEARSLRFAPFDIPRYGCNIVQAGNVAFISFIAVFISETAIVTLTMIKAYQHRRSSSSWVHQLYRDGLIFYIYLLALTIANAIVPILTRPEYRGLLSNPQRVLHSVLCTRVILLILRQRSHVRRRNTTSFSMTSRSAPSSQVFSTVIDFAPSTEDEIEIETESNGPLPHGRDWTS